MPLLGGSLALAGAWGFLVSWGEQTLPTLVTRGRAVLTLPLAISTLGARNTTDPGLVAALTLFLLAPLAVGAAGVLGRALLRDSVGGRRW
ncbi:ABC transporter permease family protein [Limnochorda pilosa]|uniref:ABC transporter permease n=1 Tax=Limnochorda pilosa TaxID=1555112 RepID=A0A0K2SHY4_LIMPI|nr:hypothetical protein [Limnochorda pilosa]BAS26708.1 hypothetical protein LIP_0851 [Limnochorda pilosa]